LVSLQLAGAETRGGLAADYEDMDERKLAILEPPYARNQNDGKSGMQRFLSKM
jgi:hypothetical protein